MSAVNRSVIGSISAEEANRLPRCWQKKLRMPCPYCSRGCRKRQHHPVDAPDLQPHVTGQDLSGSTR
jgi:hypothetical protein